MREYKKWGRRVCPLIQRNQGDEKDSSMWPGQIKKDYKLIKRIPESKRVTLKYTKKFIF